MPRAEQPVTRPHHLVAASLHLRRAKVVPFDVARVPRAECTRALPAEGAVLRVQLPTLKESVGRSPLAVEEFLGRVRARLQNASALHGLSLAGPWSEELAAPTLVEALKRCASTLRMLDLSGLAGVPMMRVARAVAHGVEMPRLTELHLPVPAGDATAAAMWTSALLLSSTLPRLHYLGVYGSPHWTRKEESRPVEEAAGRATWAPVLTRPGLTDVRLENCGVRAPLSWLSGEWRRLEDLSAGDKPPGPAVRLWLMKTGDEDDEGRSEDYNRRLPDLYGEV